jgi:hypothetical protein
VSEFEVVVSTFGNGAGPRVHARGTHVARTQEHARKHAREEDDEKEFTRTCRGTQRGRRHRRTWIWWHSQ